MELLNLYQNSQQCRRKFFCFPRI